MGHAHVTTFPRPVATHQRGIGNHPAPSFHKQAGRRMASWEKEVTDVPRNP